MNIALLAYGNILEQDIPKQFIHVENCQLSLYFRSISKHPSIDAIIVVGLEGWIDILWAYAKQFNITK